MAFAGAGAYIAASAISAAGQIGSSALSSVNASNLNKTNRGWQEEMTKRNQQFTAEQNALARSEQFAFQREQTDKALKWEEDMYNQYNSPSAMMRQYREAGLNPYLSDSGVGSAAMNASPPTYGGDAPVGSSPGTPTPSAVMPDFSSLNGLGNNILQALGVKSQIANQSANTKEIQWRTAGEIYKNFGLDAYKSYAKDAGLFEGDPVQSLYAQVLAGQVMKDASQTYLNNITAQFKQNYEAPQAQAYTDTLIKQLDVMKVTIEKLKSEGKLNDARAYELGSEVARNMSQAGLFKAMTGQIDSLLPYIVQQASFATGVTAMQFLQNEANFSLDKLVREWQHTEKAQKTRKWSRSMDSDVNVVGAFMKGFVNQVPAPLWNNSFNSKGYMNSSGTSNSLYNENRDFRSWYEP